MCAVIEIETKAQKEIVSDGENGAQGPRRWRLGFERRHRGAMGSEAA
jgi:hypothetical protein